MLSRRSSAAAARWLQRRQAEGIAGTTMASDAVDIVRENLDASEAQSPLARALPAHLLNRQQQQHQDSEPSSSESSSFFQNCLPSLSVTNTSSRAEFSDALVKYLLLTTRLVSTSDVALAKSQFSAKSSTPVTAVGGGTSWLHALRFFLHSLSSQRQHNRSFRALAHDSSPDWGAAWIMLCREHLPPTSALSKSSGSDRSRRNRRQVSRTPPTLSLSSLAACGAITKALLPLANEKMQTQLRNNCSCRVAALEQELKAQVLELDASVQAAPNSVAVLRVFLLSLKVNSPAAALYLGTGAEEAALQALKSAVEEHGAEQILGAAAAAGSVAQLLLTSKEKSGATRALVDRNFQTWCATSPGPALVMAARLCDAMEERDENSAAIDKRRTKEKTAASEFALKTLSQIVLTISNSIGGGSSSSSSVRLSPSSPAVSAARCSLLRFLCRHLTPFGDVGRAGLLAKNRGQEEEEDGSLLPLLAASAQLLALSNASDSSHTTAAWCFVSLVLHGNLRAASRQHAVDLLGSLVNDTLPQRHQQQRQRHSDSLLFVRRTSDVLRVCLLSIALPLAAAASTTTVSDEKQQQQQQQEELLGPLLKVAMQLESQEATGSASHVRSLLLTKSRTLARSLTLVETEEHQQKQQRIDLSWRTLGLPALAVKLFQQQLLACAGKEDETERLFAAQTEWLGGESSSAALNAVVNSATWMAAAKMLPSSNNVAAALASNAMWREALALCSPAEAQRLCRALLHDSGATAMIASSSSSSSSDNGAVGSTQWETAVSLLTEMSVRKLTLRPGTLVALLNLLNSSATPKSVEVNMTIQMSRPSSSSSSSSSPSSAAEAVAAQESSSSSGQEVVNLLVSVTRQLVSAELDNTDDNNNDSVHPNQGRGDANKNPLLQARVLALSSLLSSSSYQQRQQQRSHSSSSAIGRHLAGSLRAAMLLCAESGDWSSALYLISTVAKQQQQREQNAENNLQASRSSSSSSSTFTLAPDVIWKLTKALEAAGQERRVDDLRRYVAAQDVERWLDEGADENLQETIPRVEAETAELEGETPSAVRRTGGDQQQTAAASGSILRRADGSTVAAAAPEQQLFAGIHAAEFIRLRSSAIQKLAAIGKWRTAATILSTMTQSLQSLVAAAHADEQVSGSVQSKSNTELLNRAVAATVFVCAKRHHWVQALGALVQHNRLQRNIKKEAAAAAAAIENEEQQQQQQHRLLSLTASLALIRSLSRAGRWFEAVSIFSSSALAAPHPFSTAGARRKLGKDIAPLVFTNLVRACRVSRAWTAALQLHNTKPGLASFASASEVVAACTMVGFPLTKIQLWMHLADKNLFVVSTDCGSSRPVEETDSAVSPAASASGSTLSALDVSIFFALLNAQSRAGSSANLNTAREQQPQTAGGSAGAWKTSLELLLSCWSGKHNSSSSSSSNGHSGENTTNAGADTAKAAAAAAFSSFDVAREPDCVTSVIDTCIRQGQWQHAFALYNMQRLLLIPVTPHSVFLLLSAMLDRVGGGGGGGKNGKNKTEDQTTSVFHWTSALRLVSDAVEKNSIALSNSSSSSRASSSSTAASLVARPKVLQPLVAERLVQVLCRGGVWQRALDFAWFAGPSMGNLMTNDRVLDNLVQFSDNAAVVCRAAQVSGTFPVAAGHGLGGKVVAAVEEMLLRCPEEEDHQRKEATSGASRAGAQSSWASWNMALTTVSKCIKRAERLPSRLQALMGMAHLRRNSTATAASRTEIRSWLDQFEHDDGARNNRTSEEAAATSAGAMAPAVACDVAFAKLALSVQLRRENDAELRQQLRQSAESLLRYSILFGVPTQNELASLWPKRLAALCSHPQFAELEETQKLLATIAEEIP